MKVLDLFSGIGGFSLGLHRAGMKTAAFCEIEPFCQKVLAKNFPGVPIYDDIRTVTARRLAADGINTVNLVCGGDPCQPHSLAGKRGGVEDDRYLWPEMFRIVQEFNPDWVVNENVIGSESNLVLDQKISDLESAGYECQTFDIPACAVGGGHERRRLWIVANSNQAGLSEFKRQEEKFKGTRLDWRFMPFDWERWNPAEAIILRGADGIPGRLDRIKALGNTVMPQIPEIIGRAIIQTSLADRPMAQKDL